jgi:hypothetical protein
MHLYIQALDRRRLNILAQQSTHASQLLYWLFQVFWYSFLRAARFLLVISKLFSTHKFSIPSIQIIIADSKVIQALL